MNSSQTQLTLVFSQLLKNFTNYLKTIYTNQTI